MIDAGSLQVMDPEWIPAQSIVTPNKKEYKTLFCLLEPAEAAKKYNCIIVLKGPVTHVYSPSEAYEIHGRNPGMTKGGTGDVMAGLTVGLMAKNEPLLAACAGALLVKKAGEALYRKRGIYFNADDLAEEVSRTFKALFFPRILR